MSIRSSSRWSGLLGFLAVLISCDGDPTSPLPEPEFGSASVAAVASNVLSAEVTVTAIGYDDTFLVLRTPGEPDIVSPPYVFGTDMAKPAALGMLSDRAYEIDVMVRVNGVEELGETLPFTTGSLPSWIPTITPVGTPLGDGLLLLSHPPGSIAIDDQGRVRWYVGDPAGSAYSFLSSVIAHPNGEYTVAGIPFNPSVHLVLNELGAQVGTLECVNRVTRFHEIQVAADGSFWILCDNPIATDLSSRGGNANGTVIWTVLQRVGPTGTLEFEFDTSQHFSLDDIDQDVFVGVSQVNMTHGNSIAFDFDGNVLMSSRSLNEVTKIDVASGEVVWRLGGLASDFNVIDATREFQRPHGARAVAPGVIQLLDNGEQAPSRLVRYALDEQSMTATRVLEFITDEQSFTFTGGGTEVLSGEAALVSFGTVGKVVEVDASGVERFDLGGLDGTYIFRAQRISSLYASERSGG